LDTFYQDGDIPDGLKTLVKEREQLHVWIQGNNLEEVKQFASKHKELKFLSSKNKSSLEVSAEYAEVNVAATLLRTPSSATGKVNLTKPELLKEVDKEGNTLLLIACKNVKHDTDFLILCGSDINHRNEKGESAIDIAWRNRKYSAVLSLLNNDSDFPNIQDKPFTSKSIPEEERRNTPKGLIGFFV
jgi:ankyrin repeat protein